MMRYRLIRLCLLLGLWAVLAGPGTAQGAMQSEARYTIRIAGFTVGDMRLAARESDGAYSAASVIVSAGAARVFRRFSYRAEAQGRIDKGRLRPQRYEETADTGRRQSEAMLAYTRGVPRVLRYTSPVPASAGAPAASSQGGTVDPLTALYTLLRDQPEAGLCDRTITIFDGRRRSHVRLGAARRDGADITCTGEYRRLDGFTPRELRRHVAFPLTAVFTPIEGGLYRATHIELQSFYGLATVDRR